MKKILKRKIKNRKNKILVKKLIKNIEMKSKSYKNKNIHVIMKECNEITMKCKKNNTFKINKVSRIQRKIYKKLKNLMV